MWWFSSSRFIRSFLYEFESIFIVNDRVYQAIFRSVSNISSIELFAMRCWLSKIICSNRHITVNMLVFDDTCRERFFLCLNPVKWNGILVAFNASYKELYNILYGLLSFLWEGRGSEKGSSFNHLEDELSCMSFYRYKSYIKHLDSGYFYRRYAGKTKPLVVSVCLEQQRNTLEEEWL